jgi:hypothetical protein
MPGTSEVGEAAMFEKITVGPAAWDSSVMIPIDAAATAAAKIPVPGIAERMRIFIALSRVRYSRDQIWALHRS